MTVNKLPGATGKLCSEQAGREKYRKIAQRAARNVPERGTGRVRCLEHRQERKPVDLAMRSSWVTSEGPLLVEE